MPEAITGSQIRSLLSAASPQLHELVPKSVVLYLQKYYLCPTIPEPKQQQLQQQQQAESVKQEEKKPEEADKQKANLVRNRPKDYKAATPEKK